MPIVDDPFEFGRIAATNAISDVYAMGAQPIMALALVGMPVNVLPLSVIGQILDGGQSVCRAAGIPIAGGHTIDSADDGFGHFPHRFDDGVVPFVKRFAEGSGFGTSDGFKVLSGAEGFASTG